MASAISLAGDETANEKLASVGQVTPSYLNHLSDAKLATTAKNILGAARENISALTPKYNTTPAELDTFEKLIADFQRSVDIDHLDKAMELLPKDDKKAMDFYKKYHAARVIKDIGTRHRKPPENPSDSTPPPEK